MTVVDDAPAVQCANPDCKVAVDGRCIEGIPVLANCSHHGKSVVIVEGLTPEPAEAVTPRIRLPGAETLSTAAAQILLRDRPCTVIAIVGPHESGKTSLIGGIYDLLQRGPIGDFAFAGSSTLHSFERACHDSRRASNRPKSHMERTEHGDATYFHLDLARATYSGKRSVLFANRAGEDYMDTQSEPELAKSFVELRRSDMLTMLADGTKLLDDGQRHQVREDICQTLRAFQEAGETRAWQRLAIVLTKVDELRADPKRDEHAIRFFESILTDVRTQFSHQFMEIRSFCVAASPKHAVAERGEGMVELLNYWMSDPGRPGYHKVAAVVLPAARAFGRLRPAGSGDVHA